MRAPRMARPRRAREAARCAFWHALGLLFRGDVAPAMGWIARGRRVLEDEPHESVAAAWLLILTALPILFQGEAEEAQRGFEEAGAIAEARADADGTMLARLRPGGVPRSQGTRPRGWRSSTR